MTSFKHLVFERCSPGVATRWWHARAYIDYMRMQSVMVVWPFHWLVQFAHYLSFRWDRHRHKPSWIDKMVRAEVARAEQSEAVCFLRRATTQRTK